MLGLEVDAGVANIEKRFVGMQRCVETKFGMRFCVIVISFSAQ